MSGSENLYRRSIDNQNIKTEFAESFVMRRTNFLLQLQRPELYFYVLAAVALKSDEIFSSKSGKKHVIL